MKLRQAILFFALVAALGACASPSTVAVKRQIVPPFSSAPAEEALLDASKQELSVDITPPKREADRTALKDLPNIIGKSATGLISPPHGGRPDREVLPDKDRQRIVLNFEKADVAEVSNQIFGDYLKLNYVLDPTLQGRISVYLEGEFTKEELLQMVTKIYAANSISIVPRSGLYYIQPIQKSSSSSLPIASSFILREEGAVKPVIILYRLRYMDAKQAINTVKFFLTPGRPIASDNTSNTLIFVEDSDNARAILEVLKALDVNVLQEVSMEIVQLQSISPQDAVQSMEALMGKLDIFKESALKTNLAYIPLQNFGGVLILAQNPEMLKTAKQWLKAFDIQGEGVGEQIHVYFIQNGLALEIGDILNSIFGLGGGGGGRRPEQQIVGATGARGYTGFGRGFGTSSGSGLSGSSSGFGSRSSSSGLGSSSSGGMGSSSGFGSSSNRAFGAGSTGRTGTTASTTGATGGISGGFGTGRAGAGGLGGAGQAGGIGNVLSGEVIIIPDETNNALVIRANASDYAKIKQTIETLDILPRAVLIEVMIAEVTLNKNLQYGVEWFFRDSNFQAALNAGTTIAARTSTDDSGNDDSTVIDFTNLNRFVTTGGLSLFSGNIGNFKAFVTFLGTKTDVNVLSTPTLLATDNKEASITVGGREPIQTGQALTSAGDNIINSIQYEETGIILNVIPHINAGGLVRLEVEQTIRNVSSSQAVVTTSPRFDERNIRTTLLAQNGSTVVIGGIIQERSTKGKTGIPFLQDMPIIHPLFSTSGKNRERTELIIAITPHVVDHRETAPTREFLQKLQKLKYSVERHNP